jgi:hypothetical protein
LAIGVDGEPMSAAERVFGIAVTAGAGAALLGGMWLLRTRTVGRPVALAVVVLGLAGVSIWFWMLLPPILAIVVLWLGVVRGGLARELEPEQASR